MMRILNTIFIAIISLTPVSTKRNVKKLAGEWTNGNLTVIINKDNTCKWNAGSALQFEGVIESITDSTIHFSFEGDFDLRFNYAYWKNNLVLWSFKSVEDSLGYHLDEVSVLHKPRGQKMKKPIDPDISIREVFRLPVNFIGVVYVCYNQNGSDNNKQYENTREIGISEDGLSKTEFIEEPVTFGLQNYGFNRDGKDLPFFNHHNVLDKTNEEINKMGFSQDSVYVCLYGYNQTGRRYVNEEFNEEIQGNVLMFSVDTLHNILSRQYRFHAPHE